MRSSVAAKVDFPSISGRNGFGLLSFDDGHRREPRPPHKITGTIDGAISRTELSNTNRGSQGYPMLRTKKRRTAVSVAKPAAAGGAWAHRLPIEPMARHLRFHKDHSASITVASSRFPVFGCMPAIAFEDRGGGDVIG